MIAYELGLSDGSVGAHLHAAMRRLGVHARTELVALVTTLRQPTASGELSLGGDVLQVLSRGHEPPEGLSTEEEQLWCGVMAGYSDERLATILNTSTRAVANRLRALYHKFDVNSRAELAALTS